MSHKANDLHADQIREMILNSNFTVTITNKTTLISIDRDVSGELVDRQDAAGAVLYDMAIGTLNIKVPF